jgi:MerR family transcriptional regulator/heat shock protein HspR
MDRSKELFTISVVAQMVKVHPQTLRLYEREGLLRPQRTQGNTRMYSREDIERLEVILNLTREMGVNLAGVQVILEMLERLEAQQRQMEEVIDFIQREMWNVLKEKYGVHSTALTPIRGQKVVPFKGGRR